MFRFREVKFLVAIICVFALVFLSLKGLGDDLSDSQVEELAELTSLKSNRLKQNCPLCDYCTDKNRTIEVIEGNSTKEEVRRNLKKTSVNLYNWSSTAVMGPKASKAISIYGSDICVLGGTVQGLIPDSLTWLQVHDDVGGGAYKIDVSSGMASLLNARVHNVEDGFKPRETPYYNNLGTMNMKGVYMTKIRDDCIENDGFMSGRIEDCLFDGVFVFYSEQEQSRLPAPVVSISPEEDPYVYISNVLVRTDMTNGPGMDRQYTAGHWFKLMPKDKGAVIHKLKIDNSVFAISTVPLNKRGKAEWNRTSFSENTEWTGENYILWLGSGKYGGIVPAGVKFLQGEVAQNKWEELRRKWAVNHGYIPSQILTRSRNSEVKLEWSPAKNVVSYSVQRSTSKGGPYKTISSNLTGSSYSDMGLTNETTYYYIIDAFDSCGVNLSSEEVSGLPSHSKKN